ncbi:DcrB-related protein [Chamaesiphon sp. VAR_48_metabat_135_sub]|uniref:DcrB-related protein n=1 Tax=Chamaesiphon sp. VAR_48_metabat_135_sub TaxID=2964699 RepID=UPI00286C9C2F|nr:DcrB-related protein [Chamaesiphon sp. VAR_48_metabat_135_sub]
MRFIHSGISFTIALCGLSANNLTAIAAPSPAALQIQAPSSSLVMLQESKNPTSEKTVIEGNGVGFTVPAGFKGGLPSSADTKAITSEAAKMFPSMASMMQAFDNDPGFFRAIAINTAKEGNPDLVLVTRLPIPANVPLSYIQEMMTKLMPSMLPPQFKLVSTKTVTIGSRQIVQLTVDANIQGSKIKESIGLFKQGDEVFQVTYVYAQENSQQAIPIFEQIINTFQATPKAPVPSQPI